jgi:hypothetical protein
MSFIAQLQKCIRLYDLERFVEPRFSVAAITIRTGSGLEPYSHPSEDGCYEILVALIVFLDPSERKLSCREIFQ